MSIESSFNLNHYMCTNLFRWPSINVWLCMEYVSSWIKLVLIISLRAFPLFNIQNLLWSFNHIYKHGSYTHNTLGVHIFNIISTGQNGHTIQMHTVYLYFMLYGQKEIVYIYTSFNYYAYKSLSWPSELSNAHMLGIMGIHIIYIIYQKNNFELSFSFPQCYNSVSTINFKSGL